MTLALVFVLDLLLFIWAIRLLARGVRGRWIDDHPLCRKCGFDLSGRPKSSNRCSECGASLAGARAIRIGHRQHNRIALGVGVGLTLLCSMIGGVLLMNAFNSVRWQTHKPVWWLKQDIGGSDAKTRGYALKEILRRMNAKTLASEDVQAVAAIALTEQADLAAPWDMAMGDVIERANAMQLLTPKQWDQYRRNGVRAELTIRPNVRRGDPLPLLISHQVRMGPAFNTPFMFGRFEGTHISISGIELPLEANVVRRHWNGLSHARLINVSPILDQLRDGSQAVHVRCEFVGIDTKQRVSRDLSGRFTLLRESAASVAVNPDPALRERVETSMRVRDVRYRELQYRASPTITVEVYANDPPIGLAYEVSVRVAGRELPMGQAAFAPGEPGRSTNLERVVRDLPRETVTCDVIFRPSVATAADTILVHEIWGGEVVYKDVPIKKVNPVARP